MNNGMIEYDITNIRVSWKVVHVWGKLILKKSHSLLQKPEKVLFFYRRDWPQNEKMNTRLYEKQPPQNKRCKKIKMGIFRHN